jgi:hypothetical protein
MDETKVHRIWASVVAACFVAMCGLWFHACDVDRDVVKACLATSPALECSRAIGWAR